MFTHLNVCGSIMVFKLIPGEYKHNAVTEKWDSPIYENKAYNRRTVEEEGSPRKSYQVETKGGGGQMFNYHSVAVVEEIYKS